MPSEAAASPTPIRSLTQSEAEKLMERLLALGPQSAFALRTAVMAMETPGVEAELTIKIPKNPKDYLDITIKT